MHPPRISIRYHELPHHLKLLIHIRARQTDDSLTHGPNVVSDLTGHVRTAVALQSESSEKRIGCLF